MIVTGAAHGIGAGMRATWRRDGWQVACADLDGEAAAGVAAEIGGVGRAVRRRPGGGRRAAGRGRARASRPHRRGRLAMPASASSRRCAETTLESWNRVLATNLTATFLLAKAAAADLKRARGAIVTIASTRAHMSEPGTLAYSASKGGLVALTHALAMTLAPDVRVNCVSPGWIDTGRHGPLKPSDHAQHPVGRVGRPEDMAAAVAYLLSDAAGFITGAELIVDGGMTRKMIYT